MNTLPRLLESADFTPFFKSTVGFDRLMRMLENDIPSNNNGSYPPYNIEKLDDDHYRISMALAGFKMEDISIFVENNSLSISASQNNDSNNEGKTYLHRGIASRNFEQKFQLADHIEVTEASLEHGMLNISLTREIPEHKKARKIDINCGETLFSKAKKMTKKS